MVCWTGPRDRSVKPIVWSETASLEYQNLVRRIGADSPDAARRVANRIAEAVKGLAQRNTGRPGRVRDTFEKSIVGLPYVVAFAVEVHEGVERIVVLRVIHTARHWPPGQWPKP